MRISRGGGKAICMQVLKVTPEKAHSPSKPRAEQGAGHRDWHQDNRHGNIARCRNKCKRDARRPKVIRTKGAIVQKFVIVFQTDFEVKCMHFLLRQTPSVLFQQLVLISVLELILVCCHCFLSSPIWPWAPWYHQGLELCLDYNRVQ